MNEEFHIVANFPAAETLAKILKKEPYPVRNNIYRILNRYIDRLNFVYKGNLLIKNQCALHLLLIIFKEVKDWATKYKDREFYSFLQCTISSLYENKKRNILGKPAPKSHGIKKFEKEIK